MRYSCAFILVVCILLGAAASPSHALRPHTRDGWIVGLAYGPGKAEILTGDDSLKTGWVEGPAQSVRIGRMLGQLFQVGFEHQAWLDEQGYRGVKIRAGTQLEALALTFYPGHPETPWGGLFVKAGGGYAHCRLSLLEPVPIEEQEHGETHHVIYKKDEFGWGGFAALGYEFRISGSFAAGAMVSYNYLDIAEEIYDTVQFIPLVANLNWYF